MEVDTCLATDANGWDGESLDLWSLQGKDFVLRLLPQPVVRMVTAQTTPTASGDRYDTYLMATKQCGKERGAGQLIADGDDNGDGKLSAVTWAIPPDEEHYLVVEGYGDTCGKSGVIIHCTTTSPPSPSPFLPPSPPPSPAPPPECLADRATAPNQGRRYICDTFNDPHVNTFAFGFIICNTKGTMLLLSNDFLNITAETVPVQPRISWWNTNGASVIQSVSITYKNPACGSPSYFDARQIDEYTGRRLLTHMPSAVWRDDVLDTTVKLYRSWSSVGAFFNILISTPWTQGSGACLGECNDPYEPWWWGRRRELLQKDGEIEAQAIQQCTERGITGGFLDACIFDAISTGDVKTFVEASAETQENFEIELSEVEAENEAFIQRTFAPNAPTPPMPVAASVPLPKNGSSIGADRSPGGDDGGSNGGGSDSNSGSNGDSNSEDDITIGPAPDSGSPNGSTEGSKSQGAVMGAAVGGAAGGAALLAISLAAVWYLRKGKQRKKVSNDPAMERDTQGGTKGESDANLSDLRVPKLASFSQELPPELQDPAIPTAASPGPNSPCHHRNLFSPRPSSPYPAQPPSSNPAEKGYRGLLAGPAKQDSSVQGLPRMPTPLSSSFSSCPLPSPFQPTSTLPITEHGRGPFFPESVERSQIQSPPPLAKEHGPFLTESVKCSPVRPPPPLPKEHGPFFTESIKCSPVQPPPPLAKDQGPGHSLKGSEECQQLQSRPSSAAQQGPGPLFKRTRDGNPIQSRPWTPVELDCEDCTDDPHMVDEPIVRPCFFPPVRGAAPRPSRSNSPSHSPMLSPKPSRMPPMPMDPPSLQNLPGET
ncbi:hypothetical protein DUNSADRAFT_14531 [Dunaliella salina]|uniref:VWFD domain-containing protein n=1 Tax=Dunaliella salina TaxID=3046 RepID=A0ABQ7G786_DUNSA|nr:hypothetical protein DUNSADRAFT_14531 [Dunaliella salina]|eukprot:KAF5830474.1 hypothetical protein DUNSADRAFT_14531 [Dunaliella salina]